MEHNDNAYATMLLTIQLSASRQDVVRPLSIGEYYTFVDQLSEQGLQVGELIGMDIYSMRNRLNLDDQQAYRLGMLLGRTLPLSYALARYGEQCIDLVTVGESEYPASLKALGRKAPPLLYFCGNMNLCQSPAIAVVGNAVASKAAAACTVDVATAACRAGLTLVCGGEQGVGALCEQTTVQEYGNVISFLAESISAHIITTGVAEMIANEQAVCLSAIHPEAVYTADHATQRSPWLYALAKACVVISCELNKGPTWHSAVSALREGRTPVYVWRNPSLPGNMALIQRGAKGFDAASDLDMAAMATLGSEYTQMSLL